MHDAGLSPWFISVTIMQVCHHDAGMSPWCRSGIFENVSVRKMNIVSVCDKISYISCTSAELTHFLITSIKGLHEWFGVSGVFWNWREEEGKLDGYHFRRSQGNLTEMKEYMRFLRPLLSLHYTTKTGLSIFNHQHSSPVFCMIALGLALRCFAI